VFWIAPVNDPPSFTAGLATVLADEDTEFEATWATDISTGPPNESDQVVEFEIVDVDDPDLFSAGPVIDADGVLSFTPAPDAFGLTNITVLARDNGGLENHDLAPDQFDPPDDSSDEVSFEIVIMPVNDPPIADDDVASIAEDEAISIDVVGNDTDVDNGAPVVVAVSDPAHGAASTAGGGALYDPDPDFNGTDTFTYTIEDDEGGQDTATVHVTITPVNDPPDAVDDGALTPLFVAQGVGPTPLPVLANDTSAPDVGEIVSIVAVSQPAHGVVTISGGGSGLTYDPGGLYSGPDEFTYTISDAGGLMDTATVHVNVIPDVSPPVTTGLRVAIVAGSGSTSVRASVVWTGTDLQSGIARFQLQQRTDGGVWRTVGLPTPTATQVLLTLPGGHDYRFRVRARDNAGNYGAFVTSRLTRV
jgi:large repetitive protein